jgi:hypothetical protein
MAINIKPSHKGKLHRALGIPKGQKIPIARLQAAKHSLSPAIRKEANFALVAKTKFHHSLPTTETIYAKSYTEDCYK